MGNASYTRQPTRQRALQKVGNPHPTSYSAAVCGMRRSVFPPCHHCNANASLAPPPRLNANRHTIVFPTTKIHHPSTDNRRTRSRSRGAGTAGCGKMDDTECPLLSLPPELHVLILGNLEVDEICRMSMVCRTFRECCDDELWTLWQDIYKGRYGGPVAVSAFGLWKTRTVKAFKEELRVRNESGAPFVAECAAKHGHTMVLQQLS